MKNLLLIGLILFIVSCISCNTKSRIISKNFIDTILINNQIYQLDSISELEYNSVKTKNLILTSDSALIKITNHCIMIQANDTIVTYKNDTIHNESMVKYHYAGIYPEIGFIHIRAMYWEWSRDLLVKIKDGRETVLWGNPIVSPNKKYIISNSADLVATEMPNGIQLFKLESGDLVNIFEKEIINWEPYEIKWESDTSHTITNFRIVITFMQLPDYENGNCAIICLTCR